jgi:uncharacterized membrane protein
MGQSDCEENTIFNEMLIPIFWLVHLFIIIVKYKRNACIGKYFNCIKCLKYLLKFLKSSTVKDVWFWFLETASHYAAQVSYNFQSSCLQNAGITDVHNHAWLLSLLNTRLSEYWYWPSSESN